MAIAATASQLQAQGGKKVVSFHTDWTLSTAMADGTKLCALESYAGKARFAIWQSKGSYPFLEVEVPGWDISEINTASLTIEIDKTETVVLTQLESAGTGNFVATFKNDDAMLGFLLAMMGTDGKRVSKIMELRESSKNQSFSFPILGIVDGISNLFDCADRPAGEAENPGFSDEQLSKHGDWAVRLIKLQDVQHCVMISDISGYGFGIWRTLQVPLILPLPQLAITGKEFEASESPSFDIEIQIDQNRVFRFDNIPNNGPMIFFNIAEETTARRLLSEIVKGNRVHVREATIGFSQSWSLSKSTRAHRAWKACLENHK